MQIVRIGDGSVECHSADVVGAKAANLARMSALGLPVPPAFVLPISLCAAIVQGDSHTGKELAAGLAEGIAFLEAVTGHKFGDRRRPLLVSVRSGAARSMPGMLDTVLNVGCSAQAVHGLIRMTGNPRFAWDCRRRFLESFGEAVLGIQPALLEEVLSGVIAAESASNEQALDSEAVERLAGSYLQAIEDGGSGLPEKPMEQLTAAAHTVYQSWMSERACTYRKLQHMDDLAGTAVTVQAMVYGNRGASSGAGVAFSRDPSTGAAEPVIDVLFDAQGEDVVSGRRTPLSEDAIVRTLPAVASQLREALTRLEREFGDVQDVEFTIEDGTLWILQARAAKRPPLAALRFAVDLVREGKIEPEQALRLLQGLDLDTLAHKRLVGASQPASSGTAASAGIAVGRAAFDSESAARISARGEPAILIRRDTSTADVAGFAAAVGILTAIGGRTAHAALVARQMGKPCIVGCTALTFDDNGAQLAGHAIQEGDWLSIDGEAGAIYLGRLEVITKRPEAELAEVERWRAHESA